MPEPHFYWISTVINRSVWCMRGPKKFQTSMSKLMRESSVKVWVRINVRKINSHSSNALRVCSRNVTERKEIAHENNRNSKIFCIRIQNVFQYIMVVKMYTDYHVRQKWEDLLKGVILWSFKLRRREISLETSSGNNYLFGLFVSLQKHKCI